MLDFIYDSLDTVKKLKFPTVKQFVQLTTAIFGLVIVAWIYFIICDTIFSEGYKMFYSSMTSWEEIVLENDGEATEDTALVTESGENSGIEFNYEPEVEETVAEDVAAEEVPAETTAEAAE